MGGGGDGERIAFLLQGSIKAAYQVSDAAGKWLARGRPRVGQLLMVMQALVGRDQDARVCGRALHMLPHRAASGGALVVAARVRVALDHLLPILAPPVSPATGYHTLVPITRGAMGACKCPAPYMRVGAKLLMMM